MPIKRSSVQFAGGRLWRPYCLRYEIAGSRVVSPKNRAHYFFTALRGAYMQLDQRTPAWKIAVAPLLPLALFATLMASRLARDDTKIGVLAAMFVLATFVVAFIAMFSALLILVHRFDRAARAYMRRHPRVEMGLGLLFVVGMLIVVAVNWRALTQQMWNDSIMRVSLILAAGIIAVAIASVTLSAVVAFCIYLWRCWRTVRTSRPPLQ